MITRRTGIIFTIALFALGLPVFAQDVVDDVCAALVFTAIESIEAFCGGAEAGTACYAHPIVEAEVADGASFAAPGDQVALSSVSSLRTSPVNIDTGDWGIAVITEADDVEANDETPLNYIVMGDTTLTDLSAEDAEAWSSFSVRTASADPDCPGAPNKFVVQSGTDLEGVDLTINGAELRFDSDTTIIVEATPYENMTLSVVSGSLVIVVGNETHTVVAGQQIVLLLEGDSGLVVVSFGEISALDTLIIEFLPIHTFLDVVEVPSSERWTDTGVTMEAGQSALVIAAELVKTYDDMPWSTPAGHSPQDCAAIGRGDWDCRCRTLPEWGTCTLDEVASMTLLGRVGIDGQPFIVNTGGIFTATGDGNLYLGANDNFFEDNIGSYYAVVNMIDLTP
jgi:hypothetical protein